MEVFELKQAAKLWAFVGASVTAIICLVVVLGLLATGGIQPGVGATGAPPLDSGACGAGTTWSATVGQCVSTTINGDPVVPVDWYSYDQKILINFGGEDGAGTAITPVISEYPFASLPREFWGNERRFTDESQFFTRQITLVAGAASHMYTPGEKLYFHYGLALYEDAWVPSTRIEQPYVVPTSGDMSPGDAAAVGLSPSILDQQMYQFDSADWTAAAIDLGVAAANSTDTEFVETRSYLVTNDQITKVSHVVVQQFNKTEVKILKFKIQGTDKDKKAIDTGWILVWDSVKNIDNTQYSGATTLWEYDSDDYSRDGVSIEKILEDIQTVGGQVITLTIYVKADVNTVEGAASITNGEVIANNFRIDDPEGSALVDQNIDA